MLASAHLDSVHALKASEASRSGVENFYLLN
jgi:hypothetical protein